MSRARDNILGRLRGGATSSDVPAADPAPPPQWSEREKCRRFIDRMEAVRAEVIETDAPGLAEALAGCIAAHAPRTLLHDPAGPSADALRQAGELAETFPRLLAFDRDIGQWKRELFLDVDAAITSTVGGIAETGSLMLWPTPAEPRSMSLVPPLHIAVLEASRLFATFAEAMAAQRWADGMPSNALLISGPSKSADIERTLAYGVHGPKALVVVLVHESEAEDEAETESGGEDGE